MEPETFTSFREWLISHERQTPERASVIAANLRKAQTLLSGTAVYKGQTLFLNLYKDLKGVNSCRPEYWNEKMKPILERTRKIFRYTITAPDLIGTYNEYKGNKKSLINNIQTAIISYFRFLSGRYECFNLSDVQETILKLYNESESKDIPKAVKGLANWNPVEECLDATKKRGLFTWLGWKFHNSGLSGMLRKYGATIFSQGDEQLVQMPMAQFEKFIKAYEQAVGRELPPDIYKNCSFIRDLPRGFDCLSPVKETIGRTIQLYVGNEKLDFDEIETLKVDLGTDTIIIEDLYEREFSIKVPVLSGREPEKRKLSYRINNLLPIDQQASILSELREKCSLIHKGLEQFISYRPRTKVEKQEAVRTVNADNVFEAANSALELLIRYSSHVRVYLVIE